MLQTADFEKISHFVRIYRRSVVAGRLGRNCVIATAVFFALTAVLEIAFAFFPWIVLPLLLDLSFFCAGLFIVGAIFAELTVKAPTLLSAARMIEKQSGLQSPLLAVTLELQLDQRTRDNQFTREACRRAASMIAQYPARPQWPRFLPIQGAATLILGAWCLLTPSLSPRLLSYWNLPFEGISRFHTTIFPGSIAVPLNAAVDLRLTCRTVRLPSCRLALTGIEGEHLAAILLHPGPGGTFSFHIENVKKSFIYRFDLLGQAAGGGDTVTVVPPPRLSGLQITLQPPAYTRMPFRSLPEGQGDFDAYAGTRVHIAIESDRLKSACLIKGHDTIALSGRGKKAAAEIEMYSPCNYTFALFDSLGQRNDPLPSFHIGCIEDEPPAVQILRPGRNKDLQTEQLETLAVEAVDDIGIGSMTLNWRRGGWKRDTGMRYLSKGNCGTDVRISCIWQLTSLGLYPGDTVFYWAEAVDTKPFGKPGKAVSDLFWFRIPQLEEIYKSLAQKQDDVEKILGAVQSKQRGLSEQLEDLVRAANRGKELSWEQQQILHDVKQDFQSQADSLRQSVASLKETIEKMKQQGTSGEELSQKFEQARKAVEEMVRQFGDSLLFNMKDFDKPVTSQDIRASIDTLRASLPKLDEQLENTLNYLKMLKEDRKLSELAMRAEALSREQTSISRNESVLQTTAEKQKELLNRINRLSEDAAAQLRARNAEKQGMDSLASRGKVDSISKAMSADLAQKSLPSQESMNRMSGSLLSLSQDLLQMLNFREDKRLARDREKLLALAQGALVMADWQKELKQELLAVRDKTAMVNSQQALHDAIMNGKSSADSLPMLPPDEMLQLGNQLKNAEKASDEVLKSFNSGNGIESMNGNITALRSLANSLLAAASRMNKGPQGEGVGGAGMMPGLRKLSGRQAAINSMTGDLLSSLLNEPGSGEGKEPGSAGRSGEQASRARRAAQSAQKEIADELKRLSEKYGPEADQGLRDRVDELAKEARNLSEQLEHPDRGVADRQDRFLTRMLETTLSMHRQGEGKEEWKSQSAGNPFQTGISARPGTIYRDRDSFNRLRQRAFQGNYPDSYHDALFKYFETLSEKYLSDK